MLYQNDDLGKDLFNGLKAGLGDRVDQVLVAQASFEVTDPTVDSQVISLHASGAETLFIYGDAPKACSQAIRKAFNLGWHPTRFLFSGCVAVDAVLKPAGLEASKDLLSLVALKTVSEETRGDPVVQKYLAFMADYYPEGVPEDLYNTYGYMIAHAIEEVISRAGNELTRENIMKQAYSLQDFELPMLEAGVLVNTSPTDYATLQDAYMQQFDGANWQVMGELLHGN